MHARTVIAALRVALPIVLDAAERIADVFQAPAKPVDPPAPAKLDSPPQEPEQPKKRGRPPGSKNAKPAEPDPTPLLTREQVAETCREKMVELVAKLKGDEKAGQQLI